MKNKKVLLFSLAAMLSGSSLMAQQNWKVGGNALTAAGKFGTTSANDVNFISNNVSRITLKSAGNLRFNSDQTSIQFANPGATPKPMMFIYESGSVNTNRMVFAYSPVFPTFGLQYVKGDKMDFVGSGISALDIDLANKRVGVGNTSPQSKLQVTNGSSAIAPFFQSVITAESSDNAYISVLSPTAHETGILFGTSANNVDGGIIYNSTFASSAKKGLQFRTNGNFPRMELDSNGLLNVGPLSNDDYRVRVDHRDVLGFDIANSSKNTDWEFFADNNGLELFVDGGIGGFHGQFNRTTGFYSVISDERVKKNIKPMADVLERISQLKPASFQYKNEKDLQQYDGFIAQQVMKVFPNLVTHTINNDRKIDLYTMNYSGFGVIAIKGIQELMKQNDSLKSEVEELKSAMIQIKSMLQKGSQNTGAGAGLNAVISTSLTDAALEQNTPNPFSNSTLIHYTLPQKFNAAQIIITDKSGNTLKKVNLSGAGKGTLNVDASSFISGTYNYSLIVDGKLTSTKQFVLAK